VKRVDSSSSISDEVALLLSVGLGLATVVIDHHLAGFIGDLQLPAATLAALRANPRVIAPLIDTFFFTLPTVGLFAVLSGLLFAAVRLIRPVRAAHLLTAAAAWLIPTMPLRWVPWSGEEASAWSTIAALKEWPHIALLILAPLIGIAVGYAAVRSGSRRAERVKADGHF
jgi:hypothetical protein